MLVDIFLGRNRQTATAEGSFHFSNPPVSGEEVELAGVRLKVMEAWHRPDIYYRGAKFAILVADAVEMPLTLQQMDDAGAFA